jgi:hypothetical protein
MMTAQVPPLKCADWKDPTRHPPPPPAIHGGNAGTPAVDR